MNYQEARQQITTGQIVAVEMKGIFPFIIKFVQRIAGLGTLSNISHIGVAWWLDGRLYLIGMDGVTNALIPMSHYDLLRMHIYDNPCKMEKFCGLFEAATSTYLKYDWIDIIKIGIRLIFRLKLKETDDDKKVCSSFVLWWLRLAGYTTDLPSKCSPAELADVLHKPLMIIN